MSDVNKEIALKVTTDIGQTNQAFKSAEDRLNETKKRMIELATSGQQASKEFRELALEAGKIKGQLELVEQTVDGIGKSANKIEVFSGAIQGMAAGFAIAQGTAALFAEGNEELQQSLVKVQASLALLQGTEQAVQLLRRESAAGMALQANLQRVLQLEVVKSTLALRGWAAALAATGIGAVVVGLGFLIAAFMSTSKESDNTTEALDRQKEAQEQLKKQIELTTKARLLEIEVMKILGATEGEIALERLKLLAEQANAQQAAIDLEKRNIAALEGFGDTAILRRRKSILAEKQFALAELQKQILEQTKAYTDFEKTLTRETIKETSFRMQSIQALQVERTKQNKEQEDKQIADSMAAGAAKFKAEADRAERIYQTNKYYADLKAADDARNTQTTIDTAKAGFQAIADLSAFFAGASIEQQRKAFEVQKKINIATTIIDTLVSAQKAFKSAADVPVIGSILAPIAAAAALASGLARVAAIRNTTFNTASTGVVSAVRPAGLNAPQGTPPPQGFNPNTSTPAPLPPQGGAQGQGGQGQRVYVLESDITNVGRRVQSVERFATFG
jgi:hypothetical protein